MQVLQKILDHMNFTVFLGAVAGVLVHRCVFIDGEWHVQAPKITLSHLCLPAVCFVLRVFGSHASSRVISSNLMVAFTAYLATLLLSILIYRVYLHPLTKAGFPGPLKARTSKLWHVWAARNSKNYLVLESLRQKYGDFVRTGPSEITIFCPEVFMAIDGPRNQCVKSEWYDILHPNLALVTARVKNVHADRRRQWNRGFSAKALVLHINKIMTHIDRLDKCIEADAIAGKVTNARDIFFWFGFDAMGDFVFNKSFDMLSTQNWHHIIVRLQNALSLLGPFSPAPWLIQVGFKLLPSVGVLRDWHDMVKWCEKQMRTRVINAQNQQFSPDLTHYLMEEIGSHTINEESWSWLHGDSLLAIVAGSEPMASALIGAFCELAKRPEYMAKIYDEVQNIDYSDMKALAGLRHLNAALNEALRLYPALMTGGARKTTENGAVIGGRYIPPHTTIIAPRYSISRREDSFDKPHEFIPERWHDSPEMVRNSAAFAPFGTGHHSCLGRYLAMDAMRIVTARLIQKYDFVLAPGETGERVLGDLRDQFTSNPGPLSLSFKLR